MIRSLALMLLILPSFLALNTTLLWSVPSGFKPTIIGILANRVVVVKPPCFFLLNINNGNVINTVCVVPPDSGTKYTIGIFENGVIGAYQYSPQCCTTKVAIIIYNENGRIISKVDNIDGIDFAKEVGAIAILGNYTLLSSEYETYVVKGNDLSEFYDNPLLFYMDRPNYGVLAFDYSNMRSIWINPNLKIVKAFSCIGVVPYVVPLSKNTYVYECLLPDLKSVAIYMLNNTSQKIPVICKSKCNLVGYLNDNLLIIKNDKLYAYNITSRTWNEIMPATMAVQSEQKNLIVVYSNGFLKAIKLSN